MRRALDHNWVLRISLLLFAVMLWAVPSSLEASILMPAEVPLDIEQLIADAEAVQGASSSSSRASTDNPVAKPAGGDRNDSNHSSEALFVPAQMSTSPLPTGGSTSGTSTTSTGGSSGTSAFPIDAAAAASISDSQLIAWVSGERRFTLPMPPGNDLLRPPQDQV